MMMSLKQKKIEFEPRMKFNQKINITGLKEHYLLIAVHEKMFNSELL